MTTKIEAGIAGFKIDTYETRAAQAKADAELDAAQTVEKMMEQGFTEEEIVSVLTV